MEYSLTLRLDKMSKFILYIFWPSPRIDHFCKEPWFLSLENGTRSPHLGTRCVHCYKDVVPLVPSSWLQRNLCMYSAVHIPVNVYTDVPLCNYIKLKREACWCLRRSSITTLTIQAFSTCMSGTSLPTGRNLAPTICRPFIMFLSSSAQAWWGQIC